MESSAPHKKQRARAGLSVAAYIPADGEVLFKYTQVCAAIAQSKTTLYRMVRDGKFPSPVGVGRNSRWLRSEVNSWITDQSKLRRFAK